MTKDLELHLRRAVARLEKTRAELSQLKQSNKMAIAIIGMSCRLPGGSNTPEQFWEKLLEARPLIQDIPASRWNKNEYYSSDRNASGKMYTKRAGFIDDIEYFDAAFFNISRREALMMDPQQRLFIEETWQAFESAGVCVSRLKGSDTAVYFGCGSHDYATHLSSGTKDDISAYYGTGNSSSIMAGRVAYFFNFHGPAITLDTSCSSSLVAIHQACQALRSGQCSLAVAGGVNAILTPDVMLTFCKANMLSEEGLSKTFDADANGYVRGEGVGIVILKRLEDALRDNDNILASIIADGVNHDGASSGLTSPNGEAQVQLIKSTLNEFSIAPQSISYVEAHGTGTPLGDPIEINALNQVFFHTHSQEHPLYVGSVKTNIGHLEAGAGISGVIKVILSLQHKTIPAHLNLHTLNPLIDTSKIPFEIPTQARAWDVVEGKRRASVSSFGFSGTNAFIVLEEFCGEEKTENTRERDWHPVIISAKTKTALEVRARQIADAVSDSMALPDIAYTLNTGRVLFEHSMQFICSSVRDLKHKILDLSEDHYVQITHQEATFVLSFGDLSRDYAWSLMQELMHSNEQFLKTVKAVFTRLTEKQDDITSFQPKDLIGELWLQYQYALVYALFDLFKSWGALPDYVVGDSFIQDVLNAFFKEGEEQSVPSDSTLFIDREQVETLDEDFVQIHFFKTAQNDLRHDRLLKAIHALDSGVGLWQSLSKALLAVHNFCREIDWALFDASYRRKRLVLPGYPFERKKYWYEPKAVSFNPVPKTRAFQWTQTHDVGKFDVEYKVLISLEEDSYLKEHSIYKQAVFPAAGFISLMLEAVREFNKIEKIELYSFQITSPLILQEENILFVAIEDDAVSITLVNEKEQGKENLLASARWQAMTEVGDAKIIMKAQDGYGITPPYQDLQQHDINYGAQFQSISELYRANNKALAVISLKLPEYQKILSILDGALQAVVAFVIDEVPNFDHAIYLPHSFERLQIFASFPSEVIVRFLLIELNEKSCILDMELYDASNRLLGVISGYRAKKIPRVFIQKKETKAAPVDLYYELKWSEIREALEEEDSNSLKNIAKLDLRKANDNELVTRSPDHYFKLVKQLLKHVQEGLAFDHKRILFLLDRANQVLEEDPIPEQSFFIGLIKSLRLEYPQVQFFCVDCDRESTEYLNAHTRAILNFMLRHSIYDVSLRGRKLFQSEFRPLKLTEENHWEALVSPTYLILGGSSAISLGLAEAIAHHQKKAELILVTRKNNNNYKQLQKILNDEQVQWLNGDILLSEFIEKLVGILKEKDPKKLIIIHAAGVLQDRLFQNLDASEINSVVLTKVKPVIELVNQCGVLGVSIHSMLCLSSAASTFGSQGQSNYAAANALLEGYVHHFRRQGIQATAVALAPVNDTRMAQKSMLLKRYPEIGISLDEAVLALKMALIQKTPPVFTVMNSSFVAKIKEHPLYQSWFREPTDKRRASEKEKVFIDLVESLAKRSKQERVAGLKQFLMDECARVLQLNRDEFDEHSGFFELGMDSIMAIELFETIQSALMHHVKLSQTILFDLPSVAALTDFLVSQLYPEEKPKIHKENGQKETTQSYHEPIAIVGMACRLPSAPSIHEFWELLAKGHITASEVPLSRWDNSKYYDPQRPSPGKIYTNQANFIEDYEAFDAEFFSILPREVECIDPQHRLMIELTHLAFENALIPMNPLRGTATGVFIGHFTHDYASLVSKYAKDTELSAYLSLGNSASTISGRISYLYGFQGPSFPINTACSSSLVAAHLACESLRRGECNLAVVGGVNLMLAPEIMINICQAQMLSQDGRCHTFEKEANGYGRGEGAGVLILKRLKDAIEDQDNIAAIILGSGTNQDGASSALSVPNGQAQKDLLAQVLKSSQLQPEDIDYIEAHGTGTALGDPIEINAINAVYQGSHHADNPLYVSSVKANIGHLEAAAGVAGLIKLSLCLQNRVIPPHIHLNTLNPAIDLDSVPLSIPSSLTTFALDKEAMVAISAFGFSGSNAHMILKEPPKYYKKPRGMLRGVYLTKISAKSKKSLKKLMEDLLQFLKDKPEIELANLSYSMNVGRDDYDYRVVILAFSIDDFYNKVKQGLQGTYEKRTKKIIFNYTHTLFETNNRRLLFNVPAIENKVYAAVQEINQFIESKLSPDDNYDALPQNKRHLINFCICYALTKYYIELGIKPEAALVDPICYLPVLAAAEIISIQNAVELIADGGKGTDKLTLHPGEYPVYFEPPAGGEDDGIYQQLAHTFGTIDIDEQDFLCMDLGAESLDAFQQSIANAYLHGAQINWSVYECGFEQDKIQLTHYPFNKKSYLLPYLKRMHTPEMEQKLESPSLYERTYVPQEIKIQLPFEPKLCLIITDNPSFEKALKKVLPVDMNLQVIRYPIKTLSSIKKTFETLFQDLNVPVLTLYGLPLNTRSSEALKEDMLLLQVYQESVVKNKVEHQFYYLTRNASLKSPHESQLDSSAVIGLLRALNFEYSQTRYKNIDFDENVQIEEIAEKISHEIQYKHHETEVVYQHKQRLVPKMHPLILDNKTSPLRFKKNKSYVITGGLGGLGIALAKHLYEQGGGSIHLLSRREPSNEIKHWIQECNQVNSCVFTHSVDVCDRNMLTKNLDHIEKNHLPIAGIFHLAGTDDREAFTQYSWKKFDQVVHAKVTGAWHLHEYTKGMHLDYFVLFSSISSSFGSARQAPYVTANAYLDALALVRKSQGLCGQSIQWGPWAEEGLVRQTRISKEIKEHLLSTSLALHTLDIILQQQLNLVTVALPGFISFLLGFYQGNKPDFLSDIGEESPKVSESEVVTQLKQAQQNAYEYIIEDYLLKGFKALADYDEDHEINLDMSFFEMGVDSLMAVEFAEYCQKGFGSLMHLAPTLLFEVSSLNALKLHILGGVKSALQENEEQTDDMEETYSIQDIKEMSLDDIDAIIRGGQDHV